MFVEKTFKYLSRQSSKCFVKDLSKHPSKQSSLSMRPKKLVLAISVALFTLPFAAVAQQAPATSAATHSAASESVKTDASPVGIWQTIDDTTHEPRALIQIKQAADGTLSGEIVTGLGPGNNPLARCSACQDERKGQLMQGLTIIRNLHANGDVWDGGKILDPENGKEYNCRIQVIDNGEKLALRGYLGVPLLGRTQTWIRERHPAAAIAKARAEAKPEAE